jgi:Immunoglobulin I-set domain
LEILEARPEDQGVYTVRAVNPVGSDETTAKLTIQPVSAKPQQVGPLELKAPKPKKEELQQMQPPKVIVPLENKEVKEGAPVLLKATITGKPTPDVRFYY